MGIISKFKDIGIRQKLLIIFSFILLIPLLALGIYSYNIASSVLLTQQQDLLIDQTEIVYNTIADFYQLSGNDTSEFQETLKDSLADIVIGKSGYIYILNSKGDYVLSLNRERDGENIFDAKDSQGNYFIQDIIKLAKSHDPGEMSIYFYPWRNIGETKDREKIVILTYFPEWDWVIGSSSYIDDFDPLLNKIKFFSFLIGIVSFIVCGIILYFLINKIIGPLKEVTKSFLYLANYNYSTKINLKKSKDEIGQLAFAYENVFDSTRNIINSIKDNMSNVSDLSERLASSSEEVNSSTQQVASTLQDISKGSEKQSNMVCNTKDVMTNLNKNINDVSISLQIVSESSQKANENATKGRNAANNANTSMGEIRGAVSNIESVVGELREKNNQITQIIDVINDISNQTNLLALNAAIEAARAGEAGKGFAVVAEEIKKLSEESQKATSQISDLVVGMQDSSNQVVTTMHKSLDEVEKGSNVVGEALMSLEGISAIINSISMQINQISKLSSEQTGLTERVNDSITEVTVVSEQTVAGSEEVAASIQQTTGSMQEVATIAQKLAQASEELREMIEQFKV
jgi:methyl-accepting chemotaxis protein